MFRKAAQADARARREKEIKDSLSQEESLEGERLRLVML